MQLLAAMSQVYRCLAILVAPFKSLGLHFKCLSPELVLIAPV